MMIQHISSHEYQNCLPDNVQERARWAKGQTATILVPGILPHGFDTLLEPMQVLVDLHRCWANTFPHILPRGSELRDGVTCEQRCNGARVGILNLSFVLCARGIREEEGPKNIQRKSSLW